MTLSNDRICGLKYRASTTNALPLVRRRIHQLVLPTAPTFGDFHHGVKGHLDPGGAVRGLAPQGQNRQMVPSNRDVRAESRIGLPDRRGSASARPNTAGHIRATLVGGGEGLGPADDAKIPGSLDLSERDPACASTIAVPAGSFGFPSTLGVVANITSARPGAEREVIAKTR
jgi:hypothetical protein